MSFRPLPVLSVFFLISLAILIWLGNWQYSRYAGKLEREAEAPELFAPVTVEIDTANDGYAQQVYGIIDGEAVWRRYLPGRINGQGPVVFVLWDATSGTEPVPLKISSHDRWMNDANVFRRTPQTGGMASRNKPSENIWYRFNSSRMLETLGYEQESARVVEPRELTILKEGNPSRVRETVNPYATPELRDPLPPQRHFGYALTWWGLAMALVCVYAAFHHSKGRLRFKG